MYIKIGVQMYACLFVCPSVGMWRANRNPNPLMKFCTIIPTCPRKVLMQGWPPPSHPWAWVAWNCKSWRTKMFSRLHINPGSAGYLRYLSSSSIFYIYINGRTYVCLLVCGGLIEIQTPAPILMKFGMHIPTCPRKVLVQVWPPPPHPLGLGG